MDDGVEPNFGIILKPDTNNFSYKAIMIEDELERLRWLGSLLRRYKQVNFFDLSTKN